MIKSKIFTVSVVVFAAILMSGILQNNAIAYPQQNQGYSHHNKMMLQPGLYAFGTIASLQNDENGNPTWIISGIWKGSLSGMEGNQTNTTSAANATSTTVGLPNATFNSKLNMVMTNGSALHDHEIYDFRLTDMTMPNNSTTVYNGTATITMRQGPVTNVPVSIKSMESNVISIWADPAMINNHLGNTPIFGTIEKLLTVEK
ncbi:MAG: hypothetical protein M3297_07465 [Thermoproteota archaeon]|nr:hypothetical protein [Thermoproteota archaeon]